MELKDVLLLIGFICAVGVLVIMWFYWYYLLNTTHHEPIKTPSPPPKEKLKVTSIDEKFNQLSDLIKQEHEVWVKLKKSFDSLLKAIPFEVAEFDRDMNYLYASDSFKKQYGLPDNVVGLNHYQLLPEILDNPKWLDVHERAKDGENIHSAFDMFQGEPLMWYCISTENGGQIHFSVPLTESIHYYNQSNLKRNGQTGS